MSYILDALRKAERERHLGQPPTLATLPPPAETGRRRLWLWPSVGLGLGLNAVLLALFLNRPPSVADPTPSSPAPESSVATLPVSPSPAPIRPRGRPESATAAPAPAPVSPSPAPRPAPARAAPAPKAPLLETLPESARRGLPALHLDIHIYSPDAGRRFVVINGRRYREGDSLEEGPVLEAVIVDGAILRQGGQRFRLPVRR
ncbi:MAG: general secretion pathway protein GspB [Candidatus Competibacteraceae bacterium]|nr:general secretion pathway protein GspB [Candidatus Competibacteraceae bacterium]